MLAEDFDIAADVWSCPSFTELRREGLSVSRWNMLNPDERYFALLESWLMRGDTSIIGERPGRFEFDAPFFKWAEFFRLLPEDHWIYDDWAERVRYRPGLPNLALMELFGLVFFGDVVLGIAAGVLGGCGRERVFAT